MKPRYQLARKRAADLITECNIIAAPVNLQRITRHLSIRVRHEPFKGELSGLVHISSAGKAVIGVNSEHSPQRQRFTLAHEIGHYLLHRESDLHIDAKSPVAFRDERSGLAIDPKEIEANQFAAALLMPEEFVRKDIRSLGEFSAEEAIDELAKLYGVSSQAMAIRLASLKLLI